METLSCLPFPLSFSGLLSLSHVLFHLHANSTNILPEDKIPLSISPQRIQAATESATEDGSMETAHLYPTHPPLTIYILNS